MVDDQPTPRTSRGSIRVPTVVLRVVLADRPGALGAVAGRIGAVKGDLVGIEILERRPGQVVDELIVELPEAGLLDLLVKEVEQEDGVEIEDVQSLVDSPFDPQINAFEVAAIIAGADDVEELLSSLCAHTWRTIRTSWVCVVDNDGTVLAEAGRRPATQRLDKPTGPTRRAGNTTADEPEGEVDGEVEWLPMPSAGASLVLGRHQGLPFRSRERRNGAALARVADSLHSGIRRRRRMRSLLSHPSNDLLEGLDLLDR